jgi:hypothetical protein
LHTPDALGSEWGKILRNIGQYIHMIHLHFTLKQMVQLVLTGECPELSSQLQELFLHVPEDCSIVLEFFPIPLPFELQVSLLDKFRAFVERAAYTAHISKGYSASVLA